MGRRKLYMETQACRKTLLFDTLVMFSPIKRKSKSVVRIQCTDNVSKLQVRGLSDVNSKIFFLISQQKHTLS